jgi:hypothetical protein
MNPDMILATAGAGGAQIVSCLLRDGQWALDLVEGAGAQGAVAVALNKTGDAAVLLNDQGKSRLSIKPVNKRITGPLFKVRSRPRLRSIEMDLGW